MLGLVVAVILGMISLTSTATTAGMVLHKEFQTAEFIRDGHKHSTEFWDEQNKIGNEIVNESPELRQAVILLRNQKV